MPKSKKPTPARQSPPAAATRRRLLPWLVAAALLGTALWFSRGLWGRAGSGSLSGLLQAGSAKGYNLLLITLDTVRADHLGCYGYEGAETPTLDRLAQEGIRCAQATATTPLTLPSHATILTGLYPPRHGARDNGTFTVLADPVTLAESFHEAGYATGAFVGSFVLDERYGLNQGFDVYDFAVGSTGYRPQMVDFNERPAAEVTTAVLGWLRARLEPTAAKSPFFAWVHYFDPHEPYLSPLENEPRFAGRPYDAEIAYVDRELARLLAGLDALGVRERTVVVVVGDHGDSFREHDEPTHGMLLYQSTLHVPFILHGPGTVPRGKSVSGELVGLVDVTPTMRGLFGLASVTVDGLDLTRGEVDRKRAVYLETLAPYHFAGWSPLYGARSLRAKYIRAPRPEFYDLERDPREAQNRMSEGSPEAGRLKQVLDDWTAQWSGAPSTAKPMSDEERERLASLGYIQMEGAGASGTLADPKEMMGVYRDGLAAEANYQQGRYEEAAVLAAKVVARCPDLAQAVRVLAFSQLRLNRPDEGLRVLREACDRKPDPFLLRSWVQALILNERFAEARAVLPRYAAAAPGDGRVLLLEGDILAREGKAEAAAGLYRRAAELDPHRTGPMARQRLQGGSGASPG